MSDNGYKVYASEQFVEDKLKGFNSECVQSDWNQNDSTKEDYIKNRPFYVNDTHITLVDGQFTTDDYGIIYLNDVEFNEGNYNIIVDDIAYTGSIYYQNGFPLPPGYYGSFEDESGNTLSFTDSSIRNNYSDEPLNSNQEYHVQIIYFTQELKQLDEKFISYKPGLKTEGTVYAITDEEGNEYEVTAEENAEIFNDYENNKAIGKYSHAEGLGTIAHGFAQHVQGGYNIEDTEGKYLHIVGNSDTDYSHSNAHTLDWEGNAWYAGDVYAGGQSQDDEENAKKLATEEYVDTTVSKSINNAEFTELILKSSTEGSNKKFKITIDDDGNLKVEQIIPIEDVLVDFEYTNNDDGTYSITDWKGTLNGEDSVDLVVPDDGRIIL